MTARALLSSWTILSVARKWSFFVHISKEYKHEGKARRRRLTKELIESADLVMVTTHTTVDYDFRQQHASWFSIPRMR